MASRNGKANVTPAPLSTVLRERCFFVMNMFSPLLTRKHRDTKKGDRSNRGTDIEIRLLISLSVPESSSIAPVPFLCVSVFSYSAFTERVGIDDAQNDR